MPIIEQIKGMRESGLHEQDIMNRLKQQGFSDQEVGDALSQSKIKDAVYGSDKGSQGNMQKSILQSRPEEELDESGYQVQSPATRQFQETSSNYPQYEYNQETSLGTDTITEIAEQIVDEKIIKIKQILREVAEFKSLSESKISRLDKRLERIERTIDSLQSDILKRVGNYVEDIKDVKTELALTQDSFSKVLNPLTEHMSKLKRIASGNKIKSHKKKARKKKK